MTSSRAKTADKSRAQLLATLKLKVRNAKRAVQRDLRSVSEATLSEILRRWKRLDELCPGGFSLNPISPEEEGFYQWLSSIRSTIQPPQPVRKMGKPRTREASTPLRQHLFDIWESSARQMNPELPSRIKLLEEAGAPPSASRNLSSWLNGTGRIDRRWVEPFIQAFRPYLPTASFSALDEADPPTPDDHKDAARQDALTRLEAKQLCIIVGIKTSIIGSIIGGHVGLSKANRQLIPIFRLGFPHPNLTPAQWLHAADEFQIKCQDRDTFAEGLAMIQTALATNVSVDKSKPVSLWEVCLHAGYVRFPIT